MDIMYKIIMLWFIIVNTITVIFAYLAFFGLPFYLLFIGLRSIKRLISRADK